MEVMSSWQQDSDEDYEEKDFDARESFLADNKEKAIRERKRETVGLTAIAEKSLIPNLRQRAGLEASDDKSMRFCVDSNWRC
jgi:hypothetical protein